MSEKSNVGISGVRYSGGYCTTILRLVTSFFLLFSGLQLGRGREIVRPIGAALPHHVGPVCRDADLSRILERRRLSMGHHRGVGGLQDQAGEGSRTVDHRKICHSKIKI